MEQSSLTTTSTSGFKQCMSGSMGKLPLDSAITPQQQQQAGHDEDNNETGQRSTTPPAVDTGKPEDAAAANKAPRARTHTWSQVKVLIKQMRQNKQKTEQLEQGGDKKLRQTLSYPASPGGPLGPDHSLPEPDTQQPESLHLSLQQLQQQQPPSSAPLDMTTSSTPSLSEQDNMNINSGASSASSSPPLSRPTNLPLHFDTTGQGSPQQAGVKPPRTKKKKSSSLLTTFNKDKKPKCVDLRSTNLSSGSTFTNMMKKFRKNYRSYYPLCRNKKKKQKNW